MSREELREQNKRLVVEKALELFLRKGIKRTSIKDIARASGLTDRSVYRYFENKTEIVLATMFLFWEHISAQAENLVSGQSYQGMTGIEQVSTIIRFYASMYLEHPEHVRYILQAEAELYSAGITADIKARPPGRFDDGNTPMLRAILAGQKDGSISSEVNAKKIYYNSYDALLGTMQRQVLGSTDCDLDKAERMDHLCDLFVKAYQGK